MGFRKQREKFRELGKKREERKRERGVVAQGEEGLGLGFGAEERGRRDKGEWVRGARTWGSFHPLDVDTTVRKRKKG